MKTQEKTLYLVVIALLISIATLGWLWKKDKQTIVEKQNLITALTDTLVITRNVNGQQVAKISRFETEKVKDFLAIKGLTGANKLLQDQVQVNKNRLGDNGSVTVLQTDTKVVTTVPTTVTSKDTIIRGDTTYIYPEYKSRINNLGKWITGSVISNKDSTSLKLSVLNEYSIVLGEEKVKGTGFLGFGRQMKPFSEVTNLNPYSSTSTLRTYQVKNTIKAKKLSLGVQTGYSPITNQTYIGVGLQYNLINLF